MTIPAWNAQAVQEVLDSLAAQGREVVLASGVKGEDITVTYTVDMRHVGQGHEISVALPEGNPADPAFLKELLERFHRNYVALYGRSGSADAIAYAAVYLASDEAAFVHGTVIDVDGGRVGVAVIAAP